MSNLASKSAPHTATSLFSENWNILRRYLRTAKSPVIQPCSFASLSTIIPTAKSRKNKGRGEDSEVVDGTLVSDTLERNCHNDECNIGAREVFARHAWNSLICSLGSQGILPPQIFINTLTPVY